MEVERLELSACGVQSRRAPLAPHPQNIAITAMETRRIELLTHTVRRYIATLRTFVPNSVWNRRDSNPQTSALPAQHSPIELRSHSSLLTHYDRTAWNKVSVYIESFLEYSMPAERLLFSRGYKESNPVLAGLESAAVPSGSTPEYKTKSVPVWMSRPGRFSAFCAPSFRSKGLVSSSNPHANATQKDCVSL
jgi:hypothetical protein